MAEDFLRPEKPVELVSVDSDPMCEKEKKVFAGFDPGLGQQSKWRVLKS